MSCPERSDAVLDRAVEQLEQYFAGNRRDFDVPVNLAGTAFQVSVWQQLVDLAWGEVVSYGDLGRGTGPPDGRSRGRRRCRCEPGADHRAVPPGSRAATARSRATAGAKASRPSRGCSRTRASPTASRRGTSPSPCSTSRPEQPSNWRSQAPRDPPRDPRRRRRPTAVRLDRHRPRVPAVPRRRVGNSAARRPAAVREDQPRRIPGGTVVDHDPASATRLPRGVRRVRHRDGRRLRRGARRAPDGRRPHHPQPGEGARHDRQCPTHRRTRARALGRPRRPDLELRSRPRLALGPAPGPTSRRSLPNPKR